jgi:hypothetical protein
MNRFCIFCWMDTDEARCRNEAHGLFARLSSGLQFFPGNRAVELCLVNAYPGKGWLVTLLVPNCPPPVLEKSDPLLQWLSILKLFGDPSLGSLTQSMTTESTTQPLLPAGASILNTSYTPASPAPTGIQELTRPASLGTQCWFCGAPAAPSDQLRMRFFTIENYQVRCPSYGTSKIKYESRRQEFFIPRCGTCRLIQAIESISRKALLLIGVAIILLLLNANWLLALVGGVILACLMLLWNLILMHLPSNWTHRLHRHTREHPDVKALFALGWYEGNKPNPGAMKK